MIAAASFGRFEAKNSLVTCECGLVWKSRLSPHLSRYNVLLDCGSFYFIADHSGFATAAAVLGGGGWAGSFLELARMVTRGHGAWRDAGSPLDVD